MRQKLKEARLNAGMTQQQVADEIGISVVYYQKLESGERVGAVEIWDALEDLFSVHQRRLREREDIHPGQADNRSKH